MLTEFFKGTLDGFKISLELMWSMLSASPLFTFFILFFSLGSIILALITNIIRERRLAISSILDIDKMTGTKFEQFLMALCKRQGYKVRLTPKSGDYGADLVLSKNNKKIIVQAKRHKNNVGIKAVQEITSAKSYYNADECWVVTNSYFINPAKKLTKSNQVSLYDRDQLINWLF